MASKTAADVINASFRKLKVLAGEEALTAAEMADALDNFNTMMHGFGPQGIYYTHVDLAQTDTVNMPDEMLDSLIFMFADAMAEDYGVTLSPKMARDIARAEAAMQAHYWIQRPGITDPILRPSRRGRFDISTG